MRIYSYYCEFPLVEVHPKICNSAVWIFTKFSELPTRKLINIELKKISNWFKENKLSLNIDKTNFMIFENKHNNKPDLHFRIEINDKHIEKVEVTKFLGILIDNNLSWKPHTNHITKTVSKYNGIIRKVRPFLNKSDFAFFVFERTKHQPRRHLRSYLVLQRLCNEAELGSGIDAFWYQILV